MAPRIKGLIGLTAVLVGQALGSSSGHAEWINHPGAMQTLYRTNVPHTTRNGKPLDAYEAGQSFFPRVLYHALHGETGESTYRLQDFAAAGFNACHLWERQDPIALADVAEAAKLQLIVHGPRDSDVTTLKDHPAILAWYLDEEPTGAYWGHDMAGKFAAFERRRDEVHRLDPDHPVFALDVAWIMPPATEWWHKWNTAGDVTCHDNYPINQHHSSLSFENGICETVSLAAKAVEYRKPVWLCTQAFEVGDQRFPCTMPTPRELRAMSYTAIVHGATGIMYFALDSWVTRNANVVGIAPNPQASYGQDLIATRDQLQMSRDLWTGAIALNKELAELEPAILSPTSATEYLVKLDDTFPSVTPEPIRTLLKRHPAGGEVLFVVNVDAAPQKVRIELPAVPASAELMFEATGAGRFIADGRGVEFSATPYDVRIIRLNAPK